MRTSWLYQALISGLSTDEVAEIERILADRGGAAPPALLAMLCELPPPQPRPAPAAQVDPLPTAVGI